MKTEALKHDRFDYYELEENSKADLLHREVSHDPTREVNIMSYPYNCIGLLKFTNPDRDTTLNGTAFLIDSDIIVTSADNIYSKHDQSFYKDFGFYPPSFDKKIAPIKIREFRIDENFIKKECHEDEQSIGNCLAVLKLDRPVFRTKYLELKYDFEGENVNMSLYGYPKPMHDRKIFGKTGKTLTAKDGVITHTVISETGQVGSPIFTRCHEQCTVVGVQLGSHNHHGLGFLFTKELVMKICRWEREMMISKIKFSAYDKDEDQIKHEAYSFKFHVDSVQPEPDLVEWVPLAVDWETTPDNIKKLPIIGDKLTRKHVSFLDDRHKQLTTDTPLPKRGKHVITFKIIKYGKSPPFDSIYIGLITEKHKRNEYSDGRSKGSIAYLTYPDNFSDREKGKGTILADGTQVAYGEDLFIRQGGEIKMELNLDSHEIVWDIGSKKIFVSMGNRYLHKNLYLFVSLSSEECCVAWKATDRSVWA